MQAPSLEQFKRSYRDYLLYPRNLVPQTTKAYPWELEQHYTKFVELCPRLCLEDERGIDLPVRNIWAKPGYNNNIGGCDIKDPAKLKYLLENDANMQTQQGRYTKCRFVYIYKEFSRAPLRLTHEMLTRILTYYQVMPGYLNFFHASGEQPIEPRKLHTGLYQQTMLTEDAQTPHISGRSHRHYQLCYNLRGVSDRSVSDGKVSWTVRQAAFHHQFDVIHGTAVWIVTKNQTDLLERFESLVSDSQQLSFETPQNCFRASLEIHRMFCCWSAENWTQYIGHLEDGLIPSTSLQLYGDREYKKSRPQFSIQGLQGTLLWREETREAAMLLESNADVMATLRAYYVELLNNEDFPLGADCRKYIHDFAADMENNIVCIRMQVRRLDLLAEVINERKNLVAQHLEDQVAERADRLNHNMEKEAIVMRIITIVTLIYLPATFVSTFFSTDVIHYQNSDASGSDTTSYSHLAMMRWLQVTLPLTFVTILGAWTAFKTTTVVRNSSNLRNSLMDWRHKATTGWNSRGDLESR